MNMTNTVDLMNATARQARQGVARMAKVRGMAKATGNRGEMR
jgi:hypothetical protein